MTHTYGSADRVTTPDGRSLHLMVGGTGEPTVVFVSGMGLSRSVWGQVQPPVAARTRTVVYDRAGLGGSDPDPRPRTIATAQADLTSVLDHLGAGPFVLVGHSWGGPIARATAAAVGPERVAAVVAVDQVDENCDLYFDPKAARRFTSSAAMLPFLARTGLYRVLGARPGRRQPVDVLADHRREDFSPAGASGMVAELSTFLDELRGLRSAAPDLRGIPLVVVSGTRPTRADRRVRQAITAAHRRTAEETPGARLVEATGSAHLVMFDEPQLLADVVLDTLAPRA
jgi:pimeloyl-ACP methyl ester carboxylesterase